MLWPGDEVKGQFKFVSLLINLLDYFNTYEKNFLLNVLPTEPRKVASTLSRLRVVGLGVCGKVK